MKTIVFPLFLQIQPLGPFLGARSRKILQNPPIESSVRFNLTDLVTKQGSVFASKNVFLLPHTYISYLHCLLGITDRIEGVVKINFSFLFSSVIDHDINLLSSGR